VVSAKPLVPARYLAAVAPRSRALAFGSAAALVVAGALCGILVAGVVGQALAIALISIGLGGALLLVFFEVGLSEDRDRAADVKRPPRRTPRHVETGRPHTHRWPRRRG
jgi:hypothetical protein